MMDLNWLALKISRHDLSENKSLKAFNAADELILKACTEASSTPKSIAIYHDRFGYLTCHLNALNPITIYTNKSQLNAIALNCKANHLTFKKYSDPISSIHEKNDLALLKVPKSLALFELYLQHISQNSSSKVQVIAGFMTRHFSTKMVEIAEKYFEKVEQSRAVKKARTLILSGKKLLKAVKMIDSITYNDQIYRQYWGVFSAKHIDYATQYFLENVETKSSDKHVLDLASGNGVIANELSRKLPNSVIHLVDDSFLAVESAKLNVIGENIQHYFENNLSGFQENTFDLIVSNPPFHFEHDINIQIPIQLFRECYHCLKPGGNLQIVANRHLNYSSHLKRIFPIVETLAQNDKFVVLKCEKKLFISGN